LSSFSFLEGIYRKITENMATAFRRIGIRNVQDAALFLVTDWQNLRGMNNCMLYGTGIWGANSSGGDEGSPYNASLPYNTTDILTGTSIASAPATSFQENGEVATNTDAPPSRGYVYVTYGNADGASAQRVFQSQSVTEKNVQTWKSYITDGSMWIGDTPARRLFWSNSGLTAAFTIRSMTNISALSNPFSPNVAGSNFGEVYGEAVSFLPPPGP